MHDDLIKRLRKGAISADSGNEISESLHHDILQAADAIEHMQKTILRLENELGIYDDLPMVDQRDPPKEES